MTTINRSALVPYSANRIYELVLDVGSYPEFLPWCVGGSVATQTAVEQVATVKIRKGPLNTQFTTRNSLQSGQSIDVSLIEGPFKTLEGGWYFKPLSADACKVEMTMNFDFGGPAGMLMKPIFAQICESLLGAFLARADELYGPR